MSDHNGKSSPVAATLAATTTILGAPAVFGMTEPYVIPILEQNYGYGFTDLYRIAWGATTAALVFFPSRAVFQFALSMLAAGVAYHLV